MATSSIFHNFSISDAKSAEKFADALYVAENNRIELKPSNGHIVSNASEIKSLLQKRKRHR